MRQIAILGYGREGKSVFRFLKKSHDYKNTQIEIRDKKLSNNYLAGLENFDIIFRSPGIPYLTSDIQKAKRLGTKISSATELFFENCPGKIIGITGTKGKSTTSTLIYKILKSAGRDVYLAGNIGKPALDILPKLKQNSLIVLELSSFQLQDLHHSPQIAVLLDIFPDHLDVHKNFKEYVESKANITKWQKKNDVVFYNSNNKYAVRLAKYGLGMKYPIRYSSHDSSGGPLEAKIIKNVIKIPGEHQLKNALMAAAITRYLKAPGKTISQTMARFKGLPHRLQLIRTLRPIQQVHGKQSPSKNKPVINFYNDSASTNPHTTAVAIKSFDGPVILIAGGKDKNLNYKPLRQTLKCSSVRNVILYGENNNKIAKQIKVRACSISMKNNLKEAVIESYKIAKRSQHSHSSRNIIILLSPGSASFDQFLDYKHRGEEFKKIVKSLGI